MNPLMQKHTAGSLLKFSFPTIVMMVFLSIYTMVDGIFIANLENEKALSGLNLVIPGLSGLIAVAILLSAGGSAVISRKLGEGKNAEARQDFSLLVLIVLLVGIGAAVLGMMFSKEILAALGASGELFFYAYEYYRVLVCFAPACMLQVAFQYFYVAAGHPKLGLFCTLVGGMSNIMLDYIFMKPLGMGIAGAALATGIGYSFPAVVGLLSFWRKEGQVLYYVKPCLRRSTIKESCLNGSSSMIISFASAMMTWLFNRTMLRYVGGDGIAAGTIVLYSRFLLNSIFTGYASGVAPIISYNYGCGDQSQLQMLFKTSMRVVLIGSFLIFGASSLLAGGIARLFASSTSKVFFLAKQGIYLFSFSYWFSGVNVFVSTMFSALNNGKLSAFLSFLFAFVFLPVLLNSLPLVWGIYGIWLAVPAAELVSFIMALVLLQRHRKKYGYAGLQAVFR